MCGIFAIFSRDGQPLAPKVYHGSMHTAREIAYRQSGKQRHRGPDDTGVKVLPEDGVVLIHERLAVICVHTGHQPLVSESGNTLVVANGEIYNYLEQSAEIAKKRGHYKPKSDCNVIGELYEIYGEHLLEYITGMFAFVLYDKRTKNILIARDPFGIIPLYIGEDVDGNIWVASEMKCLVEFCPKLELFTPGELRVGPANNLQRKKYFKESWIEHIPTQEVDLSILRSKFESAVRSHLQCDVPFGALLSGGVDSSLVASIATKLRRESDPNYRLKTFSVGLCNAPDFKAAKLVADYIGSDHTEIVFEIEDALDGIRDIIYHLETYDVTTVRCSLPMLILARYIKSTGIKMILSGEGADEIFGGYLYFFKAPNTEEFHKELVKRVEQINVSDCLRANKVTMAKGLELRVPFLDTSFVNYVMSIRPDNKIPGDLNCLGNQTKYRIEKHILRATFANNYLPNEVLWRQKEQFSDGVGYEWIDSIRRVATSHITDEQFATAAERFPINTPTTKEAFYYRTIFEEQFPGEAAAQTVKRWVPRLDWGCPEDPSGRAQAVHQVHH
ncbi:probable asparagine synthetase [glutamine-hydrolyzing] [Anastrepha obliqua]|uniref:probable asparagine synthetase [glutamine-hydrolyzing] n=1 Tax=Anastrepha obliqua TaxID=95512 RepID=UPI00240A3E54|nr:probable asparagine synthetase [glutamine-hydrolyzing] [Anastrepha obliqua]XP_054734810.1 probable asparagine synthetase [glutamine-hydrolyzing] [Anastrepha obliqua]